MKELLAKLLLKLDGRKTAIGLVLVVVGSIAEKIVDQSTGEAIADIGWSITGLGAVHKIVKGS